MGPNRYAQRTARSTWRHADRVPLLALVLQVVIAGVLALIPAWLGALLGVPLD